MKKYLRWGLGVAAVLLLALYGGIQYLLSQPEPEGVPILEYHMVQAEDPKDAYEYNEDEIPICSLRPIALPNEREMPEEVYEEGAEVFLSRENTVPHDSSIDDEEQACLFFSDGHWFIEDRSRDNSTYVHAGAGIKLEPGDIIKMGDRQFVFSIKTRK